jgi:hypothetical protein
MGGDRLSEKIMRHQYPKEHDVDSTNGDQAQADRFSLIPAVGDGSIGCCYRQAPEHKGVTSLMHLHNNRSDSMFGARQSTRHAGVHRPGILEYRHAT